MGCVVFIANKEAKIRVENVVVRIACVMQYYT